MSIRRWLVRRRENALNAWVRAAYMAKARDLTGYVTDPGVARKRRSLARWDTLLDLWTRNGRR